MNHLAGEKSPYLIQHQHNPVDWHPWGKEAFELAQQRQVPIFLSIGYSTCYWCHVMEKESFEDNTVAAALNSHFVSIKLDREERPDIDKIYMDAIVAITGHGGWPMSVFLTPDLKPFFGGTYFPKPNFLAVLQRIKEIWQFQEEQIIESSREILQLLQQEPTLSTAIQLNENREVFTRTVSSFAKTFDSNFGGFGSAPKFPPSTGLRFLLRHHQRTQDTNAREMALHTLQKMACGGIFDHLGGGFHRYSTDEQWLVPHFEKMLYDNALLTIAYLEGFKISPQPMFATVARDTLNYMLREMRAEAGGFYSAQDAGEVGKEGEFYVWTLKELEETLAPEELNALREIFPVTQDGNFEHQTNILYLAKVEFWHERENRLIASARAKLLAKRNSRKPPHLDDKILLDWNALAISALCHGAQVLGESHYLTAAQKCAAFLHAQLFNGQTLLRRYRDGEAKFRACLDDYAFFIQALLDLYQLDSNTQWLDNAQALQEILDREFWDSTGHCYYFTDSFDPSVLVRKKDLTDGALPAGNSTAILNCLRLFSLTQQKSYRERAEQALAAIQPLFTQYGPGMCSALLAYDFFLNPAPTADTVAHQ